MLAAIQAGPKLKAVVKDDNRQSATVATATATGGMLGLLATAMSQRRAHVKDDSDDSDSDGGFSDSDSD